MAHVVFLRAANVGGKNVFRPAQVARAMKHLDVVNVGAAGTFVVRAQTTAAEIERELTRRLPHKLEMMIRPAREVRAVVAAKPFDGVAFTREMRGWVAALGGKPKNIDVDLPFSLPAGNDWQVRLDRIEGHFAFGLWQRPKRGGIVMPANAIEQACGMRATVRWWETYERICRAMG